MLGYHSICKVARSNTTSAPLCQPARPHVHSSNSQILHHYSSAGISWSGKTDRRLITVAPKGDARRPLHRAHLGDPRGIFPLGFLPPTQLYTSISAGIGIKTLLDNLPLENFGPLPSCPCTTSSFHIHRGRPDPPLDQGSLGKHALRVETGVSQHWMAQVAQKDDERVPVMAAPIARRHCHGRPLSPSS